MILISLLNNQKLDSKLSLNYLGEFIMKIAISFIKILVLPNSRIILVRVKIIFIYLFIETLCKPSK